MTKIGIFSDSHQNIDNLKEAAEWFIENEKVDEGEKGILIHLGDDYSDSEILENFGIELIRVPGVYEDIYRNSKIPNRLIKTINNKRILISHTESSHVNDLPEDLKPEEIIDKKEVEMAFVGHTHIPKLEDRKGVLVLNPGHLKSEDKKGYPPSFGIVDFQKKIAKIINLKTKDIILEKKFTI